jgi:hypothetical protein
LNRDESGVNGRCRDVIDGINKVSIARHAASFNIIVFSLFFYIFIIIFIRYRKKTSARFVKSV